LIDYGVRGLISYETCIRWKENSIGWYIKNAVEPLLIEVREGKVVLTNNCIPKEQYKKKQVEEREKVGPMNSRCPVVMETALSPAIFKTLAQSRDRR
jgi:hypothetical protein